MLAKLLTLTLAACALAGAVIYAQKKGDKKEKITPVFESSKSGTPTPIEDAPPKKPVKPNETKPEEVKPQGSEQTQQQQKPKKKKIMPSSKSAFPD